MPTPHEKRVYGLAAKVMFVGGFLWFACRWIITSPLTYLVATVIWYRYRQAYSLSPPLGFSELLIWVDGLDSTMKSAILTSVITVVGFVISFYIGTKQWRSQKEAEILLEMTEVVHTFFAQVAEATRNLAGTASRLLELRKIVGAGLPMDAEGLALVSMIEREIPAMNEARKAIVRASVEVHDIRSKYSIPITSSPLGYLGFQWATKYLQRISELVYFTSEVAQTEPGAVSSLYDNLDEMMAAELVAINEHDVPKMLGAASMSKGKAFSKVLRTNFWSVFFTGGMLNSVSKSSDD